MRQKYNKTQHDIKQKLPNTERNEIFKMRTVFKMKDVLKYNN